VGGRGERERERELDSVGKRIEGGTIYYMEAENFTALNIPSLCPPLFLVK